ncbi:MAG: tetratricopeptide repeat protein, partial [Lentisphaerae bacterium]|nr:tetratricopeptide repeat protein [Lentisphaerota bacterium]
LRDNLALRRQVEEAEGAREKAESENERLRKEMRDLDSRIAASAGLIADLRKAGAAAGGDEQKAASLKARLDDAENQKARLEAELGSLNARLSELESSKAQPAPPTVMAGSDLFRKVEAENARLRERLVEMERRRAEELAAVAADAAAKTNEVRQAVEAAAAAEMDQIKAELSAASEREERDKQKIEGLLAEIPRLEDQLSTSRALRDARPAGSGPLDLDAMQEELERREHRLRKAEKMAAMLQSARAEVREVSDREKRDMHYNMASVYMREGRFKDAEREYLQALEIDPTDAASHFNLGILYDDYMDEPRRASTHYRRYLKLAPHAPDSDQVKSWLIKLDMR